MSADSAPKVGYGLTALGIVASAVWLIIGAIYVTPRFDQILASDPNELGDFLAGSFAPLAFLWLVLGFFQQGRELRTSNQALWLQGEELRNSVEQQRELVSVTREGIGIEANRLENERLMVEERSKPIIDIDMQDILPNNLASTYRYNIKNHGETCTKVSIFINDAFYTSKEVLEQNGSIMFTKRQPIGKPFEDIAITIKYTSKAKKDGFDNFVISKLEDKIIINKLT